MIDIETFDKSLAAFRSVLDERGRQNAKWGEQNHGPEVWLAILTEEVGELAQTILQHRYPHADDPTAAPDTDTSHVIPELRREAVQVAAVGLAFIEYLDRESGGCDDA